ncbi:hypothetical protein DW704_07350 [Coprobacillus sp. AM26-5AC]|jgi:hypothetical protein|uniref:hypothetical protein n=1 Tax=Faecalibacillus intestinalis TaxID=1982626 RepID=UPI000E50AC40|nr:hypothetical protein [Faecalibacillus intestinalis]RGI01763.1 hypothetical protein DW704_07350 [Coprobacillus sp. AM26-5AC]
MGKYKYKKYLYTENPEYKREGCYLYKNESCSMESKNCPGMKNCVKFQNNLAYKSKSVEKRNASYIQNYLDKLKKEKINSLTHYNSIVVFNYEFDKHGNKNENGLLIYNHMFSFILKNIKYVEDELYDDYDINIANILLKMDGLYYLAFVNREKVLNINMEKDTVFFCIKTIDINHPISSINDTSLNLLFSGNDKKFGNIYFYNID